MIQALEGNNKHRKPLRLRREVLTLLLIYWPQTEETPYTSVKTVPGRDSNEQRTSQAEPPRRILRTTEASQEDALASGRHFFALTNGQNQVVMSELPEEVPAVTTEGATAITFTIPTTSATTTITGTETGSPRMFLPNGSPSRSTMTATCRQQMWVQHVSEGWTNGPPPDGTGSGQSSLSGPSLLEEGVPENLGHEWRFLHPFEIPGVRFPTDSTPPNQRRLAENDALVELIQTTEYLEDTPMWGQRDHQFYPLGMVTLFIEEEEGAEEEVEGEDYGQVRDHLKEKQSEGLGEVFPMELEGKWKRILFPGPFRKKSGR